MYTHREQLANFLTNWYLRYVNTIDPVVELQKAKGDRSLRALAQEFEISAGYLSDILRGNKPPSERVLKKLGLVVKFVRIRGRAA